jgi:hypothetical protein
LYPCSLHIGIVYFPFHHSPLARSHTGVPFIVGFRSRRVCQAEACSSWTHGRRWACPSSQEVWLHGLPLFSPLWCSTLTSSSHGPWFTEKITGQNVWVHLTSGRSLKVKNMKKRISCAIELKPHERELFRKSVESMENMSRSLINYQKI